MLVLFIPPPIPQGHILPLNHVFFPNPQPYTINPRPLESCLLPHPNEGVHHRLSRIGGRRRIVDHGRRISHTSEREFRPDSEKALSLWSPLRSRPCLPLLVCVLLLGERTYRWGIRTWAADGVGRGVCVRVLLVCLHLRLCPYFCILHAWMCV